MARRRMISPEIWQNEDFAKCSNLAKVVFIGLISLADDEGRGKANPMFIKSMLFPYDEKLRLIDIENALSEIVLNLSVTFYSVDNGTYYALNNWGKWQTIDRPKPSSIPAPEAIDDQSPINRRSIGDQSATHRRIKEKENKIKENIKENTPVGCVKEKSDDFMAATAKRFRPPTIEEVAEYIAQRGSKVDPQGFVDFYASKGWMVGKTPMKDWKAACRNAERWERWDKPDAKNRNAACETPVGKKDLSDYVAKVRQWKKEKRGEDSP